MSMKKPNWFERLEKRNEEVRRSKEFRTMMTVFGVIMALVILAFFAVAIIFDIPIK
jgi:hypothetical protein